MKDIQCAVRGLVIARTRKGSGRERPGAALEPAVCAAGMTLAAYIIVSVLVVIMGGGLPGLGDAALIAAARAGEGHLSIRIVLAAAMAAWMLGSAAGYAIGWRQGRGCSSIRDGSRKRG